MIKTTLISAATATLVAVGALTATAGTAIASGNGNLVVEVGHRGGPHHHRHFGHRRGHRVCTPIYRRVSWWGRDGYRHWRRVQVGERCHVVRRNHPHRDGFHRRPHRDGFHRPHRPHRDSFHRPHRPRRDGFHVGPHGFSYRDGGFSFRFGY